MTSAGHTYTLVRLRPNLTAHHPSIPSDTWHPVLSYNPVACHSEAEPGSIWVAIEGRLRKLPAYYFEFTESRDVTSGCLLDPTPGEVGGEG